MFKDFLRRLPLSRSNAYVLLSILVAVTQVVLRAILFYIDNSQSGDTTFLPPSNPHPNNLATGSASNATLSVLASMSPSALLFDLRSNSEFVVCADTRGPCQTFSINQIASESFGLDFCSFAKSYAADLFRETRLEDADFIGIHLYLLFVTTYAIARESLPHIIVIFVTRVLSFAWALGRVIKSSMVKQSLTSLFIAAAGDNTNGPCSPGTLKFFGPFWRDRRAAEYALLGASFVMVIIEAFIARRLVLMYTQRPWRVVQVPRATRKMYKLLLGFSVIIQLAAFILPTTMICFVAVLLNAPLNLHSFHTPAYLGGVITTACLLPLWVFLGWRSLRREYKRWTILFLSITTTLLLGWSALFYSRLFRWTFTTWWFLGTMMTASLLLLVITLILAVFCRLNFGKGLDHYLIVQTALANSGFAHDNFEKDNSLDVQALPCAPSNRSSMSKVWDDIDLELEHNTHSSDASELV